MADANYALDIWVMPLNTKFVTWDFTDFITEVGETVDYFFKTESKNDLGYTTVRGVAIRYVNVGTCILTVTLKGMLVTVSKTLTLGETDPTSTGNAVSNRNYYGAPPPLALADGKTYTAFFYFSSAYTDEDFQLQLHMDGSVSNQFQIEQVTVIGDGQEISR